MIERDYRVELEDGSEFLLSSYRVLWNQVALRRTRSRRTDVGAIPTPTYIYDLRAYTHCTSTGSKSMQAQKAHEKA